MPHRAPKDRRKILAVLALLGVQAGLAAGPMRGRGSLERTGTERQLAAAITPLAALPPADPPPVADPVPVAEEVPGNGSVAEPPPAATAPAQVSPAAALVPADRLYLEPILADAARQYDLPVDLILAQAWAESSWKIDAVSHKGAVGVLQLMPQAVDFVSDRLLKADAPLDALDPAANARMGARYMRHLLDRLDGDVRRALIAYNQGLSGLLRKGAVPAASAYADKVIALRPRFAGV